MNTLQAEDALLLCNLKDAGCGMQTVKQFFQLRSEGKTQQQLRLLLRQRNSLLRKVHENQAKIDCLDYLIYTMKPDRKNSGKQPAERRKPMGSKK